MLKIGICDNNVANLDTTFGLLDHYLEEQKTVRNVLCFSSGGLFCDYIYTTRGDFDFVFIDSRVSRNKGITMAAEIKRAFPNIGVILFLESAEQIGSAFQAEPMYLFIGEPTRKTMHEVVGLCLQRFEQLNGKLISITSRGVTYTLQMNKIKYLESDRRILHIHEETRDITLYAKLNDVQAILDERYVRCHQSYLVNSNYIREFSFNGVELITRERLPVSKQRFAQAREQYQEFLIGREDTTVFRP